MTPKKHSNKSVQMPNSLKGPRWVVLQSIIEIQMQRFDKETDKPEDRQDYNLISYLRKDVKAMKTELKLHNYLFN